MRRRPSSARACTVPKSAPDLPEDAVSASLGCGNPLAVTALHEGETVLDLGSGGGIDVLLSARRVGPTGTVYGLDMTDEMLALAQRNAREGPRDERPLSQGPDRGDSSSRRERRRGHLELRGEPLDRQALRCYAEIGRVLRPGGRVGITDIVAENHLSPEERAERGSHVGCIAGALSEEEYREGLTGAGLVDVEVEYTHRVADGMHGAIVRASKPA